MPKSRLDFDCLSARCSNENVKQFNAKFNFMDSLIKTFKEPKLNGKEKIFVLFRYTIWLIS